MTLIALQPAGDPHARQHYADTIETPVSLERIARFLPQEDVVALRSRYGDRPIPTWGVTPGTRDVNVAKWDRLDEGDVVLMVRDAKAFVSGVVTYKTRNGNLARDLWSVDAKDMTWECLYFLDQLQAQDIAQTELNLILGDQPGNKTFGFRVLTPEKSALLLPHLGGGTRRVRARGWASDIPREAIVASLEECRALGREAFLSKYGASPALRYVLVYQGEEFDAKAILHGAQAQTGLTPQPAEYAGSREEVAEPLRQLGFWVDDLASTDDPPLGDRPERYAAQAREVLGSTDRSSQTVRRVEQPLIRGALGFIAGQIRILTCALCGRRLTSDLLVAAHIKKRSECTEDERLDMNVAMTACKLGCDALFELGYIAVDETGRQIVSTSAPASPELEAALEGLKGRSCLAWRPETARFFAWHLTHTFKR